MSSSEKLMGAKLFFRTVSSISDGHTALAEDIVIGRNLKIMHLASPWFVTAGLCSFRCICIHTIVIFMCPVTVKNHCPNVPKALQRPQKTGFPHFSLGNVKIVSQKLAGKMHFGPRETKSVLCCIAHSPF